MMTHRIRLAFVILLLCISHQNAFAVLPDEVLNNPIQEQRARSLSRELRCMVCQNQSIDDSDAPLARDLRLLVRERITSGDSDTQVMDFLVARYGSFVLLKPRFELQTLVLWLLPPFALLIGALVLVLKARGRRLSSETTAQDTPPLSAEEQTALQNVLDEAEPAVSRGHAQNRSITKH